VLLTHKLRPHHESLLTSHSNFTVDLISRSLLLSVPLLMNTLSTPPSQKSNARVSSPPSRPSSATKQRAAIGTASPTAATTSAPSSAATNATTQTATPQRRSKRHHGDIDESASASARRLLPSTPLSHGTHKSPSGNVLLSASKRARSSPPARLKPLARRVAVTVSERLPSFQSNCPVVDHVTAGRVPAAAAAAASGTRHSPRLRSQAQPPK
jgi:hypothetical protein